MCVFQRVRVEINFLLSSEGQEFFYFVEFAFILLYVPFARYSSVCIINHPMIYQICDVMMSIGT